MNLLFRRINNEDLRMILEWRTNPDVTKFMYTDLEFDIDNQKIWYERIQKDLSRKDWIINADEEDVGLVSIVNIDKVNKRCEWAYYLGSPSVRGKGVGKSVELNILNYVFEVLKLQKLCCEVFTSNEMVIKLHEKFGSVVEGTRRRHIFKNGKYHDITEMGALKEDWLENVKGKIKYANAIFE